MRGSEALVGYVSKLKPKPEAIPVNALISEKKKFKNSQSGTVNGAFPNKATAYIITR